MTIRTKSHFAERMREVHAAAIKHRDARAKQLSSIAKHQHRTSIRGGVNKNKYGEQRSQPGHPPAMEDGILYAIIDQGVTLTRERAEVTVNYSVLEFGYSLGRRTRVVDRKELGRRVLEPRPNGRLALEELEKRVRDGQ